MSDQVIAVQEPLVVTKNLDSEQVTTSQGSVQRERVVVSGPWSSEFERPYDTYALLKEILIELKAIRLGIQQLSSELEATSNSSINLREHAEELLDEEITSQ